MNVRPMVHTNRRALIFRMIIVALLMGPAPWLPAQMHSESAALPDAPQPQAAPAAPDARQDTHQVPLKKHCPPASQGKPQKDGGAGCAPGFSFFHPLGRPPRSGPLTPKNKLQLAASDVVDPFNLITIGATAAITIGSNPDTDYGPGMKGWAKNAGTLLTEDMSGEFFATFLVPSLTRQDPRFHRMPKASIPRRIANAIVQPVWTKSDRGNPMPNFGDLIGYPAAITLANVYVPGRQQGVGPTAESSAIAIGTAPIGNFISEFVPEVAKHISIHIVFIQRIVNQIALTHGPI
ncbi:MAG TPA: hypothetical protein VMD58_00955 [Acidobacteriaceae bacterium]|nr:hypothetical protein [Acidobacteriaceae bacterium]